LTVLVNKDILFSIFNTSSFDKLESSFSTIAPSMVEYHLNILSEELSGNSTYINRANIQDSIHIDSYSLYYDYNDEVYLEFNESNNDYETLSLW
jgi:hypothetical protein